MIELSPKEYELGEQTWYDAKFYGMMFSLNNTVWKLPSKADMEEIFRSVDHDLDECQWYWCADEFGAATAVAYYNDFKDRAMPYIMNGSKADQAGVRLIRVIPEHA